MSDTSNAMTDVSEAAGGVAVAEPALRTAAGWQRIAAIARKALHPQLPQTPDESDCDEAFVAIGAALSSAVVTEIAVNNGPIAGIVTAPDGRLLVTNNGDDSVSVIDIDTFRVVNTIAGTDEPLAIAVGNARDGAPDGRAYVSTMSAEHDSIAVIDLTTNTVSATYPVNPGVTDLVVSPDGTHVYAARSGAGVGVLDTTTGQIDSIDLADPAGTSAQCLSISPDGQCLYVATQSPVGADLIVIDVETRSVVDTIAIGSPIRGVAVSPDGATVYVACCDPDLGGVVDIVDARDNAITATVEIGGFPTGMTLSRDGSRAYLIDDDNVTVLCTMTYDIVGAMAVGAHPSCVTESQDGDHLYIADCSGAVTVVWVAAIAAQLVDGCELSRLEPALA